MCRLYSPVRCGVASFVLAAGADILLMQILHTLGCVCGAKQNRLSGM